MHLDQLGVQVPIRSISHSDSYTSERREFCHSCGDFLPVRRLNEDGECATCLSRCADCGAAFGVGEPVAGSRFCQQCAGDWPSVPVLLEWAGQSGNVVAKVLLSPPHVEMFASVDELYAQTRTAAGYALEALRKGV